MSNTPDNSYDEQNTDVMTTYAEPDLDFDDGGFGDDAGAPGRPRRVLVNRYSAGLAVVFVGAACFYGGVRVEKSNVGTSSGASAGGLSALASAGGSSASGSTSKAGASTKAGAGAPSGTSGFAGPGGTASAGTEGTISSIDGDIIYLSESSGSTVKVKLSDTTTLKKTVSVKKTSLYPGDTVTITGSTKNGTITATAVTDSGASDSSTSSSSTTSSSSSTSSSGLSSLFGS